MPTLTLQNITIKQLQDKNFNTYYLIINNDNEDESYFCFERTVKEGWEDLVNNWENIKEVEIEFEENEKNLKTYKRVVSFYSPEGDIIV